MPRRRRRKPKPPCGEDTECGRLLNAMGYILNGTGTLGKGTEPISHFLIPEVLSSTGTPALFGGQIFYNAKWTGTEYVGAFWATHRPHERNKKMHSGGII